MADKKKVVIFGGGISGLTVAHECIEAGLDVHIFEKDALCGGKAKGYRNDAGMPIEHSLRIYAFWYYSLFETLKRIPISQSETVFEQLSPCSTISFLSRQNKNRDASIPISLPAFRISFYYNLIKSMRKWGISWREILLLHWVFLCFSFKSEERKKHTMWRNSFYEYYELHKRSEEMQHYLLSFADIAVAAKPTACAPVVAELFNRSLFPQPNPFDVKSMLNFMNGPTNESFIDPWVDFLKQKGVSFHMNSSIMDLHISHNKVEEAIISSGKTIQADAYVLAVPLKTLRSIASFLSLPESVNNEFSIGCQFFLKEIPPKFQECLLGAFFDSPWKIVYLLEASPIWKNPRFPEPIKAVLSVTLSNIFEKGIIYDKAFYQCSPEEVKKELLAQIGITDPEKYIVGYSLDPTISRITLKEYHENYDFYKFYDAAPPNDEGFVWVQETGLFIDTPTSSSQALTPNTEIENLFLAGEFIQTTPCKIPTMERANQSGKLCAKQIFGYFHQSYDEERLKLPEMNFKWIRKLDSFFCS